MAGYKDIKYNSSKSLLNGEFKIKGAVKTNPSKQTAPTKTASSRKPRLALKIALLKRPQDFDISLLSKINNSTIQITQRNKIAKIQGVSAVKNQLSKTNHAADKAIKLIEGKLNDLISVWWDMIAAIKASKIQNPEFIQSINKLANQLASVSGSLKDFATKKREDTFVVIKEFQQAWFSNSMCRALGKLFDKVKDSHPQLMQNFHHINQLGLKLMPYAARQ